MLKSMKSFYKINRVRKLCILIFIPNLILATNFKGIILSKDKHCRNMFQLFISHEKSLVYQLEVPHGGSFEFNLPKNTYTVTVTNKNGCSHESSISIDKKNIFKELWVKK